MLSTAAFGMLLATVLSASQCIIAQLGHAVKVTCAARQAFARGVLANWLVCVAVWQAGAASSLPGKFLGAWLPVSAFVALGLEHSARPRPPGVHRTL